MASEKIPKIKLNNGVLMPVLGLGTWKSLPNEVYQAVKDAIDLGYRHIDCAFIYGNEKEVGAAIKAKIQEGVVKREELFVVSKLWNTFYRPDLVEVALKESLQNFGMDYLDLFLMHLPLPLKEGDGLLPTDENGMWVASNVDYVDTYKAMENLVDKGLVKSIGVSNFNIFQLERVFKSCKIPPVTNQIECHPYLNQKKLVDYCKSKEIPVTAYSPFGSPDSPFRKPGDPILLEDPELISISKKHDKSVAKICLRWILDRGLIVIPKSVNKNRMAQNIDVLDFKLDEEDMMKIDGLDRNWRAIELASAVNHKYYPFSENYNES